MEETGSLFQPNAMKLNLNDLIWENSFRGQFNLENNSEILDGAFSRADV